MSGPRIILVATDLMLASRLVGLAQGCGATVEQRRDLPATAGTFDLAVVDLQGLDEAPATAVARLRAAGTAEHPVRVVAFGPHVATRLLDEARAAGADEVVSRGELLGNFPTIVRRWCG